MSLTGAINNAISGLNVAQGGMAVVSDNVANVNTEGYVRKDAVQNTVTLAGQAAGATIDIVRRVTDVFLAQESRIASSEVGRFEAAAGLQDQAIALLGDPTGDNNLVALMDRVLAEAGALAANPETTAARNSAVDAMSRLAEDVDRLAEGIRDLRRQADQRIGQTVGEVNQLLTDIHELNLQINSRADDRNDVGPIDRRSRKLDELAQLIGIRTTETAAGGVLVLTTGGLPLVDSSRIQLNHETDNSGAFGALFDPISVSRVDNNTGVATVTNQNVDRTIFTGELRGLLETRDGALNDLAIELGAFAGHLAEQLNSVHNSFTAVPPPDTLTGRNTGTLTTDPHGFTGVARFHAFDANNAVTATATVDFGAIGGTVGDVIAAVNAGLGGAGTLALTNGVMSLTAAGGSTGVAVQQDAANPAQANGRGFAHRFGLNDIVRTGVGPHFQTGLQAGSAHGFTGTVDLTLVGPQNQRAQAVTLDFGAIGGTVGDMITQLNTDFTGVATFSLSAAGEIDVAPSINFPDFAMETTSDQSARGGSAVSMSDFFGLGSRALSGVAPGFQVRADIEQDSARLSLAGIDATGTPAVFSGDNAGANALQALSTATATLEPVGRMGRFTGTLGELGGEFLGTAGQAANDVEFRLTDRENLKLELEERVAEISGVNLDEEMARLIQLQAAFGAASRVISATSEMIDTLLAI